MEERSLKQWSAGEPSTASGENPYCFLYDGSPVRLTFLQEERTLQDQLVRYFVSRKQARSPIRSDDGKGAG